MMKSSSMETDLTFSSLLLGFVSALLFLLSLSTPSGTAPAPPQSLVGNWTHNKSHFHAVRADDPCLAFSSCSSCLANVSLDVHPLFPSATIVLHPLWCPIAHLFYFLIFCCVQCEWCGDQGNSGCYGINSTLNSNVTCSAWIVTASGCECIANPSLGLVERTRWFFSFSLLFLVFFISGSSFCAAYNSCATCAQDDRCGWCADKVQIIEFSMMALRNPL